MSFGKLVKIIVVLSHANTDIYQAFEHSVILSTDRPSAAIPRKERLAIADVQSHHNRMNIAPGDLDTSILSPHANFKMPTQNIALDFYIPNPLDYVSRAARQSIPFYVQAPSKNALTGRQAFFSSFERKRHLFEIYYEGSTPNTPWLQRLSRCLAQVLPETFNLLGRPLDLDRKSEINFLVTSFEGPMGGKTLGLFSAIDRFDRDGDKPLSGSNYGETIYISARPKPERACSTAVHEYQHLINFDHKVLLEIPEDQRNDLSQQSKRGLYSEHLGLDEGYSHIVEELSGQPQVVSKHIYNFLVDPNRASFALETAWSDLYGNSRSRGLNTFFLYYVIRQAGGRLRLDDPNTRDLLTDLIHNKGRGFENIARYFGVTKTELMSDFFTKFALTLYDVNYVHSFLPPLETDSEFSRGITFMDRSDPIDEIKYAPPFVHPYQVKIPKVVANSETRIPAQGLAFFRYIAPKDNPHNAQLTVSTNRAAPYSVYFIRVK